MTTDQKPTAKPQPVESPREECTPAGIQLLIPGVPPLEKPTKAGGAQLALF